MKCIIQNLTFLTNLSQSKVAYRGDYITVWLIDGRQISGILHNFKDDNVILNVNNNFYNLSMSSVKDFIVVARNHSNTKYFGM